MLGLFFTFYFLLLGQYSIYYKCWEINVKTFLFVLIFRISASPVLVVTCSAGSGGQFLHWAWLCFGSVPEC